MNYRFLGGALCAAIFMAIVYLMVVRAFPDKPTDVCLNDGGDVIRCDQPAWSEEDG